MYNYINVIKFNDQYFEHGDEVVVTKNDGSTFVGSIIIKGNEGIVSDKLNLFLDVSEKYHQKRMAIYNSHIKNIQKVNN